MPGLSLEDRVGIGELVTEYAWLLDHRQMTLLRLEPGQDGVVRGTVALVPHVAKSGGSGTYIDLVGEYRDEYVRTPSGKRSRRRALVQLDDI